MTKRWEWIGWLAFALVAVLGTVPAGAVQLEVASIKTPPVVDGILNDEGWRSAIPARIGSVECRAADDGTYLYLAFHTTLNAAPPKSPVKLSHDDQGVLGRRRLEWLWVDVLGGEVTHRYSRLAIEPFAGWVDYTQDLLKDPAQPAVTRFEWNPDVHYQEQWNREARRWTVELRVALKDLNMGQIFPGFHRSFQLLNAFIGPVTAPSEWHRLVWKVNRSDEALTPQTTLTYPDPKTTSLEEKRKIIAQVHQDAQAFFDALSGGVPVEELQVKYAHLRGFLMPWFGPMVDIWKEQVDLPRIRQRFGDPKLHSKVGLMGVFMTSATKQEFLDRLAATYGPLALENFNRGTNWGQFDPKMTEEAFLMRRDGNVVGWYQRITEVQVTPKELEEKYRGYTRPTIKGMHDAIEKYRTEQGQYPATLEELIAKNYVTEAQTRAEEFRYAYDVIHNTYALNIAVPSQEPWLGLRVQPVSEKQRRQFQLDGGVNVEVVDPASPAFKGGILQGDILLQVEKETIRTPLELLRVFSALKMGSQAHLTLFRNGRKEERFVEVAPRP